MSAAIEAIKKAIELEKSALEKYREALEHLTNKDIKEALEKIAAERNQSIDTLHWMLVAESGGLATTEEAPKETGATKLAAGKCPFSAGELEKMGFKLSDEFKNRS